MSSLRVQDCVIGRQESYRVFVHFEEHEVEDEVLPGDFPQLDARGLAPAPLLAIQGLDSIYLRTLSKVLMDKLINSQLKIKTFSNIMYPYISGRFP